MTFKSSLCKVNTKERTENWLFLLTQWEHQELVCGVSRVFFFLFDRTKLLHRGSRSVFHRVAGDKTRRRVLRSNVGWPSSSNGHNQHCVSWQMNKLLVEWNWTFHGTRSECVISAGGPQELLPILERQPSHTALLHDRDGVSLSPKSTVSFPHHLPFSESSSCI